VAVAVVALAEDTLVVSSRQAWTGRVGCIFLIDEGEKDIDRTYLLRRCAAEKVSRLVK